MTPSEKRWLALGGVVVAMLVAFAFVAGRRRTRPAPATAAADPEPSAPYHQRRRFPNLTAEAPAPAAPAPVGVLPSEVAAPTTPAPPASAIVAAQLAGDHPPPAPPQTSAQWITGYRDAVCGCKTRSCVRELQGRFVSALGATGYVAERDEERYVAASHEAIACYAALPEDS
jgi:hypothetical protein